MTVPLSDGLSLLSARNLAIHLCLKFEAIRSDHEEVFADCALMHRKVGF
jgi:hypothetical protein